MGKHMGHAGYLRRVPISNGLVEGSGRFKHIPHICDATYIPITNVFIKGSPILESAGHIRHRRNIPVADVPVGSSGVGFVGEPQVDGGLEVGVGKRNTA